MGGILWANAIDPRAREKREDVEEEIGTEEPETEEPHVEDETEEPHVEDGAEDIGAQPLDPDEVIQPAATSPVDSAGLAG